MFSRGLAVALVGWAMACAGFGEPAFEVRWRIEGQGGFSAANALRDTGTGQIEALVVCEGATGVVCLDLKGNRQWTHPLDPPVTAAPAVADVDGDGREDVVAGDSKGNVIALTAEGKRLWSAKVPGDVTADSCPAIADIDGDGKPEVLVGDASGAVSCLNSDGGLRWRFCGDGTRMGPVLVAELYAAPGLEVIVTSHDRHVYAVSSAGEWLWDFYFPNDLFPNSTPILADVNGDALPELYVGGGLNHFYGIGPGAPRVFLEANVQVHTNTSISAADLDGDGREEVVFGHTNGSVSCYGAGKGDDVKPGFRWTQTFQTSSFASAPTFANLDADPALEILLASGRGDIQMLDTDGSVLGSFDAKVQTDAAPLAGDLDGDGLLELILTGPGIGSPTCSMAWLDANVPWAGVDGLGNARFSAFSDNRARTGRILPAASYPLFPTPEKKADAGEVQALFDGEPLLLSGLNTWRFRLSNPRERRAALLLRVTYPDGSVQRFMRHVWDSRAQTSVAFDVGATGEYTIASTVLNADTRAAREIAKDRLTYRGFESDRAYLESRVFKQAREALDEWRSTNPRGAQTVGDALDRTGAMLDLVMRTPADGATAALAKIRAEAERLRAIALAGPPIAPSCSFFTWTYCPWAYFHPKETVPTEHYIKDSPQAELCLGEYESLALNVTNVSAGTLEVRVLPETNAPIEVRRAVVVPTDWREEVADALPLLDQGQLLSIPSLESQQLWITIHADGIQPGAYQFLIGLKGLEPDPTDMVVPIRVTVYDLALPRPRPLRFCLWSTDGGPMGTDNPAVLEALVDHGTTVFFGACPTAQCDAAGAIVGDVDFTKHDETVARLGPHGFLLFQSPQNAVSGQPFLSEPWRKAFVTYVRAWAAHMKQIGRQTDWALYPYDEPTTPYGETVLNLVAVAKLIREADPSILIYADPTCGTTMETVAMFDGLIDVWCPSVELLERLGEELVPAARRTGKEIWYYDSPGHAKTLSCLGHYRRWSWFAWTHGFTGAGFWTFAHHGAADRWAGPNPTGDFFCVAYDSPGGGVVTSKRWEATRDGIEDYEYLWLLRDTIAEAEKRGAPANQIAEAKALLDTAPTEIEAALNNTGRRLPLTPDSVPEYEQMTKRMEDVRRRIVETCLRLKGK